MAVVKLGQRPKNFKKTISVSLPEGGTGTIECVFTYRTMTEWGAFADSMVNEKSIAGLSWKEVLERKRETNADYIMKVVEGWNLDSEFNKASVLQLCDEYPGIADEIINQYRDALIEGRLGN